MGLGPNEVSGVGRDTFYTNLVNFTNKVKITNKLANITNKAKITNKLVIIALALRIRIEYFARGMGLLGTGVQGWRSGQMRCPCDAFFYKFREFHK